MVADTSTSLRRGLFVLQALQSDAAMAAGGLGVIKIADVVGEDKSQVSRTLRVLHEHGLVDRDPETRAYRLGWALFALAVHAGDTRLLAAGERTLKVLGEMVEERVHLTVLQGVDVLTVISESPPQVIQAADWVGRSHPVHCSSAGQALLLDHTLKDLVALLPDREFTPLGPNGPRTVAQFYARIEAARARGYAMADEEFEPGLVAVAAPVRDFRGRIVAAINLSGPKFRLEDRLAELGGAVAAAASRMSALLGWAAGRESAAVSDVEVHQP
jgi:DNA-binding IclR family transcriptional regulator